MKKSNINPTTNIFVGIKSQTNQEFINAIIANKNNIPALALTSISFTTFTS
jgi:hypothetical protein